MAPFDYAGMRQSLMTLGTDQLVAFAAFWAQRLVPMYERFSVAEGFGSVVEIQSHIDLAWLAATGQEVPAQSSDIARWEGRLLSLAPHLEARPILAFAAVQCVSATLEALLALHSDPADHALEAVDNYADVLRHFLLFRDHPGLLMVTRDPDPLNLGGDPIWGHEVEVLDEVIQTVASERAPSVETIVKLKSQAKDDAVSRLVENMFQLSVALSRGKATPQ